MDKNLKKPSITKFTKSDINRAAKKLSQKWDPQKLVREDPLFELNIIDQKSRDDIVYKNSSECTDCIQARDLENDETALCKTHFEKAMGF